MAFRSKHRKEAGAKAPETPGTEEARTKVPLDSITETAEQIVRHATGSKQPLITVLEVMLSGGSYAEDAETRNRGRYAVLSALGIAGYVPSDAEHIGYAEVNWPRGKELEGHSSDQVPPLPQSKSPGNSKLAVPFEWFEPNQQKTPKGTNDVLVVWLNADAFADHSLKRLAQLNHLLDHEVSGAVRTNLTKPVLQFKLLNPSLYNLLHEDLASKGEHDTNSAIQITKILTNLTLFSSWATTADALLWSGADGVRSETITDLIRTNGPALINVTCTDDQLIEELLDELALRGVHPEKGHDAVMLLSEWDTFYGRALPITFAAVVKYRMNDLFTTNSFLDMPNLAAQLNSTGGPYPFLSSQLSYYTRDFLQSTQWDRAKLPLAADFNRILEKNLDPQMFAAQFVSVPAASPLTNHLGPVPKGKRMHLNRLLLEQAFGDAIAKNQFSSAVEDLKANASSWPSNILHFTYLRGVDGKAPGDAEPDPKDDKRKAEKTEDPKTKEEVPRAEGHSQMDYMPRLAKRLAGLEKELERERSLNFKAVGILGSDVYDKLLVLQALRPAFHDELFFTTDLDARLLHPHEFDWTRNLIVASSFGLQLNSDIQADVPPFRDTYQAGTYLACLAAMDYPSAKANLGSLAPRRFEIGRAGAYDLSLVDSPVHPPTPKSKLVTFLTDWSSVLWLLVSMVSSVGLVALLSRGGRAILETFCAVIWRHPVGTTPPAPFADVPWWWFRLVMLAPVAGVALFFILVVLDQNNRQGEPFVLTQGISIWPTETLRMVAACLTFYFLFRARADLRDNKVEMSALFGLPELRKIPFGELWNARRSLWISRWHPTTGAGDALYEEYNLLGYVWCRWYRTLWSSLSYIGLGIGIFCLSDLPFRPYRGALSLVVDGAAMALSSLLVILLLFFVVDSSLLCRKFINILRENVVVWPSRVCEHFEAASGANCDHLQEYISFRIIASRSEAVGKLIYYPFLILFLLIVARSGFWDRWDWPPSMMLIFGLNAAYAVYAVLSLRKAAEEARKVFLRRLNAKLLKAIGDKEKEGADQIRELIKDVESCDEGAFAPVTQQPVIRAIMMPFGGAGLVTLLNYVATKM
jgi:hypothetical protein